MHGPTPITPTLSQRRIILLLFFFSLFYPLNDFRVLLFSGKVFIPFFLAFSHLSLLLKIACSRHEGAP